MLLNDFSQVPVMSGRRTVKGAITWKSMATALHRKGREATLGDALVRVAEYSYRQELIAILPQLGIDGFVLVRGPQNEVITIVTTADVVYTYGEMAGPFFLVGELDKMLREIIASGLEETLALSVANQDRPRPVASLSQLSMGDYVVILRDSRVWQALGWQLDRTVFCGVLDDLRQIRNDVMHFNLDLDAQPVVERLRHMIRVIREYSTAL
jgi:hypothetical protein